MWNKLLDKSIYFSFDKSGFIRHQIKFVFDMKPGGGEALITGGTSGIGFSVAEMLSDKNISCVITGRNKSKGKSKEYEGIRFKALDMCDWDQFEDFVLDLPKLDYVVLNAGGMPEKFSTNDNGIESQMASQLFGHYYLLKKLKEAGKLVEGCRVVIVSSGGMYLKKLDLNTISENESYDKVETYANVKRAQLILNEEIAKDILWKDVVINAMHPGWVDTPGVESSIPKFYKFTKCRLREPWQGADTIVWLLLSEGISTSGDFYFDRKKVSPYMFKKTKESLIERKQLMKIINKKYEEI